MNGMTQLFSYKTDSVQEKLRCADCGDYFKYIYDKGHILECTACGKRIAFNIFNKPALLDAFWFSAILAAAVLGTFSFGALKSSVLVSLFVGLFFAIGGFLVTSIAFRGIFNRVFFSVSDVGVSKLIYLDKNPVKFVLYAGAQFFLGVICLIPGIIMLMLLMCYW